MTVEPTAEGWMEKLPSYGYDASLCPDCGEKSTVIKTGRASGNQLVRYRTCPECLRKFKTVELYCFGDKAALQYGRKEQNE